MGMRDDVKTLGHQNDTKFKRIAIETAQSGFWKQVNNDLEDVVVERMTASKLNKSIDQADLKIPNLRMVQSPISSTFSPTETAQGYFKK